MSGALDDLSAADLGRWTIDEAVELVRRCQPACKRKGWTLTLFGSTLYRGEGNDIDLLAVTFANHPTDPQDVITAVLRATRGSLLDTERGADRVDAVIQTPDGRLIDLKIFRD